MNTLKMGLMQIGLVLSIILVTACGTTETRLSDETKASTSNEQNSPESFDTSEMSVDHKELIKGYWVSEDSGLYVFIEFLVNNIGEMTYVNGEEDLTYSFQILTTTENTMEVEVFSVVPKLYALEPYQLQIEVTELEQLILNFEDRNSMILSPSSEEEMNDYFSYDSDYDYYVEEENDYSLYGYPYAAIEGRAPRELIEILRAELEQLSNEYVYVAPSAGLTYDGDNHLGIPLRYIGMDQSTEAIRKHVLTAIIQMNQVVSTYEWVGRLHIDAYNYLYVDDQKNGNYHIYQVNTTPTSRVEMNINYVDSDNIALFVDHYGADGEFYTENDHELRDQRRRNFQNQ